MSHKAHIEECLAELSSKRKTLTEVEKFSILKRIYEIEIDWAASLNHNIYFKEIDSLIKGGPANNHELEPKLLEINSNLRNIENRTAFDEMNNIARNNQLGRNRFTRENPYTGQLEN